MNVKHQRQMKRRSFLKRTALAGISGLIFPQSGYSSPAHHPNVGEGGPIRPLAQDHVVVGVYPADRFNLPDNERRRMVLHFSKNLVDWCFAGVVAIGPSERGSRHYAAMDIDGDDLVILSRSGDEKARNAHDGNLATFHRVKNFRELVY